MTIILKKWLFEIFQNRQNEKKNTLLTPSTRKEKEAHVAVLHVQDARARRTCCTCYVKTFVVVCVLLLLACLGVGGYYIYRDRISKENRGRCGVGYVDMQFDPKNVRRFEEEVHVGHDYEKLRVPSFDECHAAVVVHDFSKRYSSIVDVDHLRCFIWPLNSTQILPPATFWDMVIKITGGYYMPDLKVVRDDFRVLPTRLTDLRPYGRYISDECSFFDSYALQRVQYTGFVKRASERAEFYGEFVNSESLIKHHLLLPSELQ